MYTFKFFFVLSIKHIMKNIFNAEFKKKVSIGLLCIRCYIILCEFIWVTKISYLSWMIFKKKNYNIDFLCRKEWKWTMFSSVNDIYIIEMHIDLTLSAMSISFSLKVVSIVFSLCSINYNYHVELIFTILFITIYWLCPLFHLQIYYLTI